MKDLSHAVTLVALGLNVARVVNRVNMKEEVTEMEKHFTLTHEIDARSADVR